MLKTSPKAPADATTSQRELLRRYYDAVAAVSDQAVHAHLLEELVQTVVRLSRTVNQLLRNTLPREVADEIKHTGAYTPRLHDCTILFTDLVGFSGLSKLLSVRELNRVLHELFSEFDDTVAQFGGTKIKTIGDAYMAVFGAPVALEDHATAAVEAGLAMQRALGVYSHGQGLNLAMRVGIHSGEAMGCVVGKERIQFDVFGDNVNIAARFESSGAAGRVNISAATRERLGARFMVAERGAVPLKNMAPMLAFFVSDDETAETPR